MENANCCGVCGHPYDGHCQRCFNCPGSHDEYCGQDDETITESVEMVDPAVVDAKLAREALDDAQAVIMRVQAIADEYEHGNDFGRNPVLVQVAARLRRALDGEVPA